MNQKKNKKWMIWTIIGILVLIFIIFVSSQKKEDVNYDATTAVVEEMTTYYSFSGSIEAKNKESIVLTSMTQINTINVSEGDKVNKDDVLFTTIQGNQFKTTY